MSGPLTRRRLAPVLVLLFGLALIPPTPASAVTRGQVDQACANSSAALAEYREASSAFQEAAEAFEAASLAVDNNLYRQERTSGILDLRRSTMEETRSRFEEQAIEAYMSGGGSTQAMFLSAPSLDSMITAREFLSASIIDEKDAATELAALQGELIILQADLEDLEVDLREVEQDKLDASDAQEAAMVADQIAWEKLEGECRRLQKQYEIEQARAAAARGSAAGGISAAATPGFICPFPGSSFTNSWGAPRSGGRGHRGVDMMGPYGAPLYAVASGTVYTGNGGLGGKTIWLIADYGTGFYYAHLDSFNVSSGSRVSRGDVVGYNGDSGNAEGGAPHLHFEIHPNGRSSAAVNPYPTVRDACR